MRTTQISIKLILALLIVINISTVQASFRRCKTQEVIKIGCTIKCKKFYRWALKSAARRLKLKVQIHNLYSDRQSVDLSQYDGILLPGGEDIQPKFYTKNLDENLKSYYKEVDHLVNYTVRGRKRDPHEYNILKSYFKQENHGQPLLGICRGMQMLSASQDLPLYVDLKAELGIKNRRYKIDRIKILDNNSLIKKIMKKKSFLGFKNHHQAIRYPYFLENADKFTHLKITGASFNHRVPEVLEFKNRPVLGVQFHPELSFGKTRRRIFKWFLNSSCENKVSQKELGGI